MSEVASDQVAGAEPATNVGALSATLGATLAAERKAKEWTVEHVASQLNLAARQIQALETDNYAALPGMASVRGFVRAYAKLLKIDATPLVAMIASEQITPTLPLEPKRQLAAASFSDNRMMSADHRRSPVKTILVGIVVVLLALGAIVIERMGGWPTLSQSLSSQFKELSAPSASNSGNQSSTEDANASAIAVGSPVSSPEVTPATAAIVASAPANSVSDTAVVVSHDEPATGEMRKPGPTQTVTTATPPVVPQKEAPTVPSSHVEVAAEKPAAVEKGLLVVKVHQDSWVEVRAGKDALLSRLMRAGSTEQVEVNGPAVLTLGNAAGVDASFRGSSLDIKAEAKNNVARLNLK